MNFESYKDEVGDFVNRGNYHAAINAMAMNTTTVEPLSSATDGQVHFFSSSRVSKT